MSNVGLKVVGEDRFDLGMVRSVARHLIPAGGVYDHVNGLHDDDGSAYRRGGCAYLSTSAFGSDLRFVWDGVLTPGQRTLIANGDDFGVLDAVEAPVNLGGAGVGGPTRAVKVGDLLFVGGGAVYGGSRKASPYSTGTVALTSGSATVTGTGTAWAANVDSGMILRVSGGRMYVVKSVEDNTHLTLTEPFIGSTASGQSYTAKALESDPNVGEIIASIFGRLLVAEGNKVKFSAGRDPGTGVLRHDVFNDTDFHVTAGGDVLGIADLRDTAFVFTTGGVYAILGLASDLLDPTGVRFQQSVEVVNRDLVLWGKEGLASWDNELVVPCLDGVYRLGVASAPQLVSRSITPLYAQYVRAGYRPGLAVVYRNHYVLPILTGNTVIDVLVCRLDRPASTRFGTFYPWSRWDPASVAGNVRALAVRVGGSGSARSPRLLGASAGGKVVNLSGCWEPSAAAKADPGGAHSYLLETRDVPTGSGELNHVRRCRLRYELGDAASDDPRISGAFSTGSEIEAGTYWGGFDWGEADWASTDLAEFVGMAGVAKEDSGRNPFVWHFASRTRFIRGRFRSADPCAKLTVRSVEWFVRPSGKDS